MGEEGGIQGVWWLGGDEAQNGLKFAGGEQATAVMGLLLLCRPSEARSLENMASASGKLGGVAGVLLGVHICGEREHRCGECCPLGSQILFTPIFHPMSIFDRTKAPISIASKDKK